MEDNYDFTGGKRGPVNENVANKKRISIRLDPKILQWFRKKVEEKGGGSYQTLMNKVLLEYIERNGESFEEIIQRVIHAELSKVTFFREVNPGVFENGHPPRKPHNPQKHQGRAGA